jgi:pyocin large subunit-like protein
VIWAGQQRGLRPTHKIALWAYADRANDQTGLCWPSAAWVADFTGLDVKTVKKSLKALKAANLIADSGERKGKTKQVIVYRLAMKAPASAKSVSAASAPRVPSSNSFETEEQAIRRATLRRYAEMPGPKPGQLGYQEKDELPW